MGKGVKISEFWKRTLSGAVFVAVLLAAIYFQQSAYVLTLLLAFVAFGGMHEFYAMAYKSYGERKGGNAYALICGVVLYLSFALLAILNCPWGFGLYLLMLLGMLAAELFKASAKPVENMAINLLGNVYVALPLGLVNFIATEESILWTFALFVLIWTFDTGAYLTGRAFGRHKMFERISPKKTWEGEIGGLLLAMGGGALFSLSGEAPVYVWMLYGLLLAAAGTFGDLVESMIKRECGFKDSGNVMPGHGGLLDRFDSLLFAAPTAFLFLQAYEILQRL